jgi:hypothetical protein
MESIGIDHINKNGLTYFTAKGKGIEQKIENGR